MNGRRTKFLAMILATCLLFTLGGGFGGFAEGADPWRVDEPVTLTLWCIPDAKMTMTKESYGELAQFIEMEKRTNITIEWIHPSAAQGGEQFNLMLVSRDFPDMIQYDWSWAGGGPAATIADGVILKLNDLMDEYAPALTQIYADNPRWKRDIMLDDGTFYCVPFIRSDMLVTLGTGLQIRQDWLDQLGLPIPSTFDEFESTLIAFKDLGDEIIPYGTGGPSWIGWFIPTFGVQRGMYNDNGTVKYGPIEPGFKEWLEAMTRWYQEGLISPEYPTHDATKLDQMITTNISGSYNGMLSGSMGRYLDLMRDEDPSFSLIGVPYLEGPNGKTYSPVQGPGPQTYGMAAISTGCKDPVAAMKWLDFQYSEEGQILHNFGVEGISYEIIDGRRIFKDIVLHNPDGLPVTNAVSQFCTLAVSWPSLMRGEAWSQMLTHEAQLKTLDIWGSTFDDSIIMPRISLTDDESKAYAQIINDIDILINETVDKVIMGIEPISRYDEVVDSILSMDIDRAIEIHQAALDRYFARG